MIRILLRDYARCLCQYGIESPQAENFRKHYSKDNPEFAELANIAKRLKVAIDADPQKVNAEGIDGDRAVAVDFKIGWGLMLESAAKCIRSLDIVR